MKTKRGFIVLVLVGELLFGSVLWSSRITTCGSEPRPTDHSKRSPGLQARKFGLSIKHAQAEWLRREGPARNLAQATNPFHEVNLRFQIALVSLP
jgi:hypothetical protein